MRIVITADTYPPDVNGAARFAQNLAEGMASRGHDVHVIVPSPKGRAYIEKVGEVTEHRLRSHEYPMFKGFYITLPWETKPMMERILTQLRPDVVHTQAHFVVGRYAIKAANKLGIPLVATNHFMPENLSDHLPIPLPKVIGDLASSWAWHDLGVTFRSADCLTAPTQLAVDLMRRRARLGGGQPISCGIDSPKYAAAAMKAAERGENEVPTILFVGRLEQEKRVGEIIQALAQMPADAKCRLEVIGQGTKRDEWQRLASDLGVADRVVFRGYVPEAGVIEAFGACDIFCQPGIAELQSIVTLEAMSASKPVVLADAVALPHLCRHGENGYLFQPGNIRQLAEYLTELVRSKEKRQAFGAVSAEMVKVHSFDATLDKFEALYERAIGYHQD